MKSAAKDEWRAHWPLPLAASLGSSTTASHVYSQGALMAPLEAAFGFSRAEISVGTTVSAGVAVVFRRVIGFLVDRWHAPSGC
jgi:hypothetical protein